MAVNCPKIELFPSIFDALGLDQKILSTLAFDQLEENPSGSTPQFIATLQQGSRTYTFVVTAKNRSTPNCIESAMLESAWNATELDLLPMVIVPYLNERQLDRLERRSISGIDLCGNYVIVVNNALYLRRTGEPNLYKDSSPTKFAYKGTTSLVPRLFLTRPTFESVSEIQNAISELGCNVALSTVSKALKKMEDDLLIARTANQIQLLQADELLDKLQKNFQLPPTAVKASFTCNTPIADLFENTDKLILSGASSYEQYCSGIRGDKPIAYCSNLTILKETLADELTETNRFADLTIKETKEKTPFFDGRLENDGTLYASPLQAYLELSIGDKREQQMAEQIKLQLLKDLPSL
jgi:hypothetical protein